MSEDFGEERQQPHQKIATLEIQVEEMKVPLSDGLLNEKSLEVAQEIEDQFAQHHRGGRTMRIAKIQVIVREAIRAATQGEEYWNAWHPNSVGPEPDEPITGDQP